MGKLSAVLYLTIAAALLLFISYSPNPNTSDHHQHRRLKLRSNFTFLSGRGGDKQQYHEPVAFDPLVADIERHREDKEWEKMYIEQHHKEFAFEAAQGHEPQPEWEDFMDAEDYLNDEERFNIDVAPADGLVSEEELTEWIVEQARREALHRTQREMEVHDINRDGSLSFAEYEPPSWAKSSDSNTFGYDMGWWKEEHFNASDVNGDGLLNITEFNDFLHPADTKNPKLLQWLCKEEIRERDTDKDGKVNFNEFFHGIFDLVRNYGEGHNSSNHPDDSAEAPSRKLFAQLDKDGDGLLSDADLLPIIEKLHPSEHSYAKQQADYIISQADTDKDRRLTLSEMVESPYVFYSSIFSDEEDYEYHDELR
ncbi:hypothetical protein Nepgr_000766 [Nepenthes gracilis]|uniref:EF-hand domain-containing protein n=1 Tax=Nepenthes gracilis TaxID=150966 RepID=A0AAD3P7B8_NEPGR|nr:hypothetical protein Nepgr_000766 [Nepenthes gracilis]